MKTERNSLTIAVLAHEVADHLAPCLESLRPLIEKTGARTLVVLNKGGDNETAEIAHNSADTVIERPFENFSRQRNYALDFAESEWLFFIDADERGTPALCDELATVIDRGAGGAWRIPRRNVLFGREMKHTGWWPDYQVRLMRRAQARYDDSRHVHEYPVIQGDIFSLLNPLIHYNYTSWRQFISKQRMYAPLEANALFNDGAGARMRGIVGQPVRELWRRLVVFQGYRDGAQGIALSVAMSVYKADVYRRLIRMSRRKPPAE